MEKFYIAAGCFWGVEAFYRHVPGVVATEVGYANGTTEAPSYEEVCTGRTGHAETVEVLYNPDIVSYEDLVRYAFFIMDPTTVNKQGPDVGTQYRSGFYVETEEEADCAKAVIAKMQGQYKAPIVTEVLKLKNFYSAEDYHQDYLQKNPGGYCHVSLPKALQAVREDRVDKLSPLAKNVMLEQGTEAPFTSEYCDVADGGVYVDAISGQPLFTPKDQFECPCGWPSFVKPIDESAVTYHEDFSHGMHRIEVRSASSGAHLGHVFDDGPRDRGGKRYCINGCALRLVQDGDTFTKKNR